MDVDLMVLSVGNSRLAIGVFSAGKLVHVNRVAHGQRGDWREAISSAWALIAEKDDPAVAGSSVNPPLQEALEQMVREIADEKIQWVGRELDLPMPVKTSAPEKTGADRIVNVAAAFEQMGKACVVVDAGTAITVDLCGETGEFLGGAIAPGLGMMLDALHEKTAKLPRVKFEVPTEAVGKSTESAIRSGVYHMIRGMVKDVTETYAMELGQWPEIIATGGDASVLFEGWELVHAIAPDLTLYGIALAFVNHHLKHES